MDKIDVLIKEIEQRIAQLENDKLIDSTKKAIVIRENKRFLVRCQQLFLSDVSSRFIYLVTNESDRIIESAWSNFEEAKQECERLEKIKPQKTFMVVELPKNDR